MCRAGKAYERFPAEMVVEQNIDPAASARLKKLPVPSHGFSVHKQRKA